MEGKQEYENNNARVEVFEHSEHSSLMVTFRTMQELDDFLESRFRRLLLDGLDLDKEPRTTSHQLDVMNEVQGQVVLSRS